MESVELVNQVRGNENNDEHMWTERKFAISGQPEVSDVQNIILAEAACTFQ